MSNQNPGCMAALMNLFAPHAAKKPAGPEIFPYRLRDDFLSPAEASFYQVLKTMVGDRLVICPQVSLAGVFFTIGDERQAYQNKIDRKRLDFLLCDAQTLKPVMGIELDDSSHGRPDRQERDVFVEKVFATANLPLARVPVRGTYNMKELAAIFQSAMNAPAAPGKESSLKETPSHQAPTCPKCGVPMLPRTAKHGNRPGQSFWGCPNYPRCREMVAYAPVEI